MKNCLKFGKSKRNTSHKCSNKKSPSSVWVAGIFCLWVTMFATEPTHHIRELAHRVSGKISRSFTFKVNADYSYHRATHDISQSTTYLTNAGDYVTVAEQTSPLTKTHLPKLSVNYMKNADQLYFNETFYIKGKFE